MENFKTFNKIAEQGDIRITKVDGLPDDAKELFTEDGKHVVAHSETGHHHFVKAAEARFYSSSDPMVCYLSIEGAYADLVHDRSFDTHKTIRIPPGTFTVRRQREGTLENWRNVQD